jgi:hypothetical protein
MCAPAYPHTRKQKLGMTLGLVVDDRFPFQVGEELAACIDEGHLAVEEFFSVRFSDVCYGVVLSARAKG